MNIRARTIKSQFTNSLITGLRLLGFILLSFAGIAGIMGSGPGGSGPGGSGFCYRAIIESPLNNSQFYVDETIRFEGIYTSCQHNPEYEPPSYLWSLCTGTDCLSYGRYDPFDEEPYEHFDEYWGTLEHSFPSPGEYTIRMGGYQISPSDNTWAVDYVTVRIVSPPEADIFFPDDGTTITIGTPTTFVGIAEEGASLQWSSNLDGILGTDSRIRVALTTLGTHTITFTVEDSEGLIGTDSITIHVITDAGNAPPTAQITAPPSGTTDTAGGMINFAGTGTDLEDDDSTLAFSWSSSLDGSIGDSDSFVASLVKAGSHEITLSVMDSGGLIGTDTITLGILNSAPTLNITFPSSGDVLNEVATIIFTGTGTDLQDVTLPGGSLEWSSSSDGVLGAGNSLPVNTLTPGPHTITLTGTDSDGGIGSDSINITINAIPMATITSPTNGTSYNSGDTITFSGTGSDDEDGSLSGASLVWSSNIDGEFGNTGSFDYSALTVGTHAITLTATDSMGATGTNTIVINIVAVTAPPIPVGVSATPYNEMVSVEWTPVGVADSYNLYWLNSAGVTTADNPIVGLSGPPYYHTGLTNGTPYYYVITAVNTDGESGVSTEAHATPSCTSGPPITCTGDWSCPMLLDMGGYDPALILDSNDTPHVTYAYSSIGIFDEVVTFRYRNNLCSFETINDNGAGTHSSIARDSLDNLHVSYDGGMYLGYAFKNAGTGIWEDVGLDWSSGDKTSIAVDDSDYAHISYQNAYTTPQYVKYATNRVAPGTGDCDDADWECSIIDDDSGFHFNMSETSIVTTAGGYYHIVYYDHTAEGVMYVTNESGSNIVTPIEETTNSGTPVGAYPGIAVDNNGDLHAIYMDYDGDWELKYATNKGVVSGTGNCGGGDWECSFITDGVVTSPYQGKWNAIVVDSSDNVHIAYSSSSNNPDLRYGVKDASTGDWTITAPISPDHVPDPGAAIGTKALSVDSNGKAHIVFTEHNWFSPPQFVGLYYIKQK